MPYRVILTARANKSFGKLPHETRQQVSEVLGALSHTPVPFRGFDVNKLKGLGNSYRIRIGDWRVIYEYHSKTKVVIVHDILRREKAYR